MISFTVAWPFGQIFVCKCGHTSQRESLLDPHLSCYCCGVTVEVCQFNLVFTFRHILVVSSSYILLDHYLIYSRERIASNNTICAAPTTLHSLLLWVASFMKHSETSNKLQCGCPMLRDKDSQNSIERLKPNPTKWTCTWAAQATQENKNLMSNQQYTPTRHS